MNARTFFITGRPRSRTAWLANFLTWGSVFCFHDSFLTLEDPRELRAIFGRVAGRSAVGHSDPANLFFQDALREEFPDALWIFIDRPAGESARAFERAVDLPIPEESTAELERQVERLLRHRDVLTVPFADLEAKAWALWNLVSGGLPMPMERLRQLIRLQVQVHPDYLRRDLEAGLCPALHRHVEVSA